MRRTATGGTIEVDPVSGSLLGTSRGLRLWRVKGRAMQRVIRRERLEAEAVASGRAGYAEARLAAQARRLLKRLGMVRPSNGSGEPPC